MSKTHWFTLPYPMDISKYLVFVTHGFRLPTITINAREEKDYVPPQAPEFGESVSSTWTNSIENLATFGKWSFLVLVSLTPWLFVLLIIGIPLFILIRKGSKSYFTPAHRK